MNKVIKIITSVIAALAVLVIVFILASYIIREVKASKEKKEITNEAITYISKKYNINENEVELSHTNLYGEHEKCRFTCWENKTDVKYGDKECAIVYHIKEEYYSDTCQSDEIKKGFETSIKKKYNFITSVEAISDSNGTAIKYNGNIEDYFKEKNADYGISTKIWIKASDNNQARSIYQNKIKSLIIYLEGLSIDYDISISRTNTKYKEYTFYYISSSADKFKLLDNISKNSIDGLRKDYKDGKFIK